MTKLAHRLTALVAVLACVAATFVDHAAARPRMFVAGEAISRLGTDEPIPRLVSDEPIDVELVTLTSIDWKPGDEIPEEIKKLDGKRIRIKGVMALGTMEGVDTFQLVNDGCACGTTKVHHFVEVTLGDDTTEYTPDEITVTGTFSVGEVEEDGFVVSLFRLADASYE